MSQQLTVAQILTSAQDSDRGWTRMSSEGGRARADRYSGEALSEWASRGGQALLAKYGPDYFAKLRKRRKNYPKHGESSIDDWESSLFIEPEEPEEPERIHSHTLPRWLLPRP